MEQPVVDSSCSRKFRKTNNGTLRWVSTTFDRQRANTICITLQTAERWQWYCSRLLFRSSRAWMFRIPTLETCYNTRNFPQGISQLTYRQEEVCRSSCDTEALESFTGRL